MTDLIITHVDPDSDTITVRNTREGTDVEYVALDDRVLALAILFKNRKLKEIVTTRRGIISDIRGRLRIRIWGTKTEPRGVVGARKEKSILRRYMERAGDFMTHGMSTGPVDIGAIIFLWLLVIIIGFFIGLIIYLVPSIILAIASVFTLGETYRMRHTVAIKCSLHRRNINRFREYISEVIMQGAYVSGIPQEFVDILGVDTTIYRKIRLSYHLLMSGLILICGSVAVLLILFLSTKICPPLGSISSMVWLIYISGATMCLGFVLLLMAGWIHRFYSSRMMKYSQRR